MKSVLCAAEFSKVQDLGNAYEMSRTTPGISQRLGQSLFRRTASCVETQGGQFEHFSFIVRVLEHDSSCI